MTVTFEIPNIAPFSVNVILDTGATSCCIDKRSVLAQALEENSYTIVINGVNSKQSAIWKLKGGQMIIGENKFRVPFTYSFEMTLGEGIQMVLGCNFIISMQGGSRIEGNTVTFYKNVTTIITSQNVTSAIEELELDEMEYLDIKEHKITEVQDDKLKEKKGMRSWLGVLNYARTYIPNLSSKLGPLYEKTSPHGDKRMKASDWVLVKQIKAKVQQLPDLEIPLEHVYIILETDGSMIWWGGLCKWKPKKVDPRSMERVCAYAHGKFPIVKSVINAEIFVVMETMSALKIHFLDKEEITLRIDCQAIIIFHNKSAKNKPSRVRWITFTDFITGTGVKVNFEHIDDKLNIFADSLSKLMEGQETIAVLTEEGLGGSTQFPLLTEYEDLIHDIAKKIIMLEEHQKRHRMKEIEDQAIRNASLAINELELIQQMKEYDFNHRRHLEGGKENYWTEKLPIIQETRKDLWRASNALHFQKFIVINTASNLISDSITIISDLMDWAHLVASDFCFSHVTLCTNSDHATILILFSVTVLCVFLLYSPHLKFSPAESQLEIPKLQYSSRFYKAVATS
ncbi:hypothetical protein ZIOFF_007152 [Zingiber officinale]|uniref:Retropepsins domain-containing protein n=1 Tax=Zingiber officinale TaxID=94328 RepID=A0A8J5I3G5_ZINOF|nr:hypothetical protein ZIOFF_007152 [Zingiber officinale]